MKNKTLIFSTFFLMIILVTLESSAQNKNLNFTIKGTITGSAVPAKIYLKYDPVTEKRTDSCFIINGHYIFKGNIEVAVPATLSFSKVPIVSDNTVDNKLLNVILENGEITITSDFGLMNAIFTGEGSKAQNEFEEISSFSRKESVSIQTLMQTNGYESNDSLKKIIARRSANLLGNALSNMITYVRTNPESPVTPYLTYSLIASGFVQPLMIDTLRHNLPSNLNGSKILHAIDLMVMRSNAVTKDVDARKKAMQDMIPIGSKAIDFTQNDVNDHPVSLASYRGKYVLIDFWASWCIPCRAENPNVLKAFQKYKNKGFTVLGISLDAKKDKWLEAIQKDGMLWTQVSDLNGGNNSVAKLYGVDAIPQNFLVNPEGVVVAKNLRADQLQDKLNEIFR